MTLVVDASVIVAALVDSGVDGDWALDILDGHALAAPHHMPIEAANILRRASLAGDITPTPLRSHTAIFSTCASSCPPTPRWQNAAGSCARTSPPYDAVYVALAEQLDAPLATLDQRLAATSGPRCLRDPAVDPSLVHGDGRVM